MFTDTPTPPLPSVSDAIETLMDAGIVTDVADQFGEPGYSADGPVLLGDYWCHRSDCAGRDLHDASEHYPAQYAALEAAGAEMEWYDEWTVGHAYIDGEGYRSLAYRTHPDSCGWMSSIMFSEDACEYLTPHDGIAEWIAEVVNDPHKCLPLNVWGDADMIGAGYAERECGFENGWHPGQNDDPSAITEAIRETDGPDVDIVFQLTDVGQFDIRFCVWVKPSED